MAKGVHGKMDFTIPGGGVSELAERVCASALEESGRADARDSGRMNRILKREINLWDG